MMDTSKLSPAVAAILMQARAKADAEGRTVVMDDGSRFSMRTVDRAKRLAAKSGGTISHI